MYKVCNLCGQDDAQFLYTPRLSPGPVVRCWNCGLVYINPIKQIEKLTEYQCDIIPSPTEKTNSQFYQQIYLADAKLKHRLYGEILDRIEFVTRGAGMLLDIGSYLGLFMQAAIARGWQCKGIEPDRDAWLYSKNLGLDVCLDVLEKCKFISQSFEVVTLLQVFEHVYDPRQMLLNIHKILRPKGIVFIEVPNIDCICFKIIGKWHRHFAKHHFTFFTPKTLRSLLNLCGFRTLSIYFPRRTVSFRFLDFALSMWHPFIHKFVSPILRLKPLQNFTITLNFHDIISICAQKM